MRKVLIFLIVILLLNAGGCKREVKVGNKDEGEIIAKVAYYPQIGIASFSSRRDGLTTFSQEEKLHILSAIEWVKLHGFANEEIRILYPAEDAPPELETVVLKIRNYLQERLPNSYVRVIQGYGVEEIIRVYIYKNPVLIKEYKDGEIVYCEWDVENDRAVVERKIERKEIE